MIMDAKLCSLLSEFPPLNVIIECQVCGEIKEEIVDYFSNRHEYMAYKSMFAQIKQHLGKDEDLDEIVFADVCKECRKRKI